MLIGEFSQATGANPRLLRYYEQQGLLNAERDSRGYRHYDPNDVETVIRIRALLNVGLPLKTVQLILPCTIDATPRVDPCRNLVATLREHVARLDAAEANIQRSRTLIHDILERSGAPDQSTETAAPETRVRRS